MSKLYETLVNELNKLPGIGTKTAQKLAFHIINLKTEDVAPLVDSIISVKQNLHFCSSCGHFTEGETCSICADESRDRNTICVVQESSDVLAFERLGEYKGLYHVLHGVISPLNGISADDLNIKSLLKRVEENPNLKEIIIATNPDINGETTALYLSRLFKDFNIKTTRLAYGLPAGAALEYADNITLSKALNGRSEL